MKASSVGLCASVLSSMAWNWSEAEKMEIDNSNNLIFCYRDAWFSMKKSAYDPVNNVITGRINCMHADIDLLEQLKELSEDEYKKFLDWFKEEYEYLEREGKRSKLLEVDPRQF